MYINLYEILLLLYIHTFTAMELNTSNPTKIPHVTTFLFPACTLTYSLVLSSLPDTLSYPPYIKFCQFRNVFPGTYCGLFGLGARSAGLGPPTSLVLILT